MIENITLHIEDFRFDAIVGILEHERKSAQTLLVEAHIAYNYYDRENFLDYVLICEKIKQCMQTSSYELLESALTDIVHKLKKEFTCITKITLCIKKPHIMHYCVVGASITKDF